MIELKFTSDTLEPALARLAAALTDMTPAMQDIGEMLVFLTQERMLKGLTPEGTPFAPRSQATLDRYAKLNISFGLPLSVTGDLRNHLHYEAGSDRVAWGSNAIQAAMMQLGAAKGSLGSTSRGGPIPWGDIPARPYLGVSAEDETDILAELEEWLLRAAGELD